MTDKQRRQISSRMVLFIHASRIGEKECTSVTL